MAGERGAAAQADDTSPCVSRSYNAGVASCTRDALNNTSHVGRSCLISLPARICAACICSCVMRSCSRCDFELEDTLSLVNGHMHHSGKPQIGWSHLKGNLDLVTTSLSLGSAPSVLLEAMQVNERPSSSTAQPSLFMKDPLTAAYDCLLDLWTKVVVLCSKKL